MDLGLNGRVYVLTGASAGLGFAAAACLVEDGARVVISSRDAGRVEAAVASLTGDAGQPRATDDKNQPYATGVVADLADPDAPGRLVEAARAAYGRFDGALISVGGPPRATVGEATDDQWRAAFETIFIGSVRAARLFTDELGAGGAVGFVLSSSVRVPLPGLSLSNGLRPGLAGVVKDLANAVGPRGVRVFSLLPHRVLTDRNRELFAATGDAAKALADAEASIPLRRLGEPAEFGRVAAFLLSPAASYLTGLAVPVDGGAIPTF
ncbi:MAG: SDR family oxidoreductase [Micromonosporaceae bacterium]